jgi:hypothetical protein
LPIAVRFFAAAGSDNFITAGYFHHWFGGQGALASSGFISQCWRDGDPAGRPRLVTLAAPIWLSGEVQDIAHCGVAIMKPGNDAVVIVVRGCEVLHVITPVHLLGLEC